MKSLALVLCSTLLLTACGTGTGNGSAGNGGNRGVIRSGGGNNSTAETDLLNSGSVKVSANEFFDPRYDVAKQSKFLKLRCLDLGKALVLLDDRSSSRRNLGREEIQRIKKMDAQQTQRWKRGNPGKPVKGLVIPRHIGAELAKPIAKQDIKRLASHGRLLQAAYKLESLSVEAWKSARIEMMAEGAEGREFLAAQMIRRLSLAAPKFVRLAQETLANFVGKEATPFLVAAVHLDLPQSMGVFPKRAAETLGLIGPSAVPEILKVFHTSKGEFLPVTDSSYRVRRYLAKTLGHIGGDDVLRVLAQDLLTGKIKKDTPRFIYEQVLIEALGNTRSKSAAGPIKTVWMRYFVAADYGLDRSAKTALRKITGVTYNSPDEVPEKFPKKKGD